MLISLAEYAKKVDRDPATIRQRVLRGSLNAIKIGRNWCIEEDEPFIDHRENKNKEST